MLFFSRSCCRILNSILRHCHVHKNNCLNFHVPETHPSMHSYNFNGHQCGRDVHVKLYYGRNRISAINFLFINATFCISSCRYIAVTQPIKYAKHKNSRRVCLTILLVWAISAAIGSPIVLGLNNTPDRVPDLCVFYNSDFIVYSSLSSFYIPCIIMVFLYWNIFKVSPRGAGEANENFDWFVMANRSSRP